jgi:magnesium chelatase family protein
VGLLGTAVGGEPSRAVRARVEPARARQRSRYASLSRVRCNAHASGRWLDTRTPVDVDARDLLASAAERGALSARAYHRVLKVARTIADLDDSDAIRWTHVAEALRYRPMESRGHALVDGRNDKADAEAAVEAPNEPPEPASARAQT